MYDFVHKQKRVAQIILALLILPFAFFGMESYFQVGGREAHIAEVAGEKILQRDFDRRLREQQDRMREVLGAQARPEMFESTEFRTAILEGMIQERLLQRAADASGLRVSDAQLQAVIAGQPEFQENGAFSLARYQSLLRTAGMSETMYQERVRTELALSQVQAAFTAGTIMPSTVVDRLVRVIEQQREASQLLVSPEAFLKQVELEPDAVQKFYAANRKEFEIPEQVRVEYLLLRQKPREEWPLGPVVGAVTPGEKLEDAIRRQVHAETGLRRPVHLLDLKQPQKELFGDLGVVEWPFAWQAGTPSEPMAIQLL